MPAQCKSHIQRIGFIKKFIKTGNYDIVHANLFPVIYYCSIIKKISGRYFPHLVMTEHNTDNRRRHYKLLRPIEKVIYNSYEQIISISKPTQDELTRWLKVSSRKADRFVVIHNGIFVQRYSTAQAYEKGKIFPEIGENDVLLCMVGSFTEQKNHTGMMEIMRQLPDRYKLVLAGEGPLFEDVKKKYASLNSKNRVVFLGFRRDVPEIMKTANMIVIPSKWEGFGLVAAEAMACGKPVIVSDVPGLRDIVGDAGLKADPNDSNSFCQRILELSDKTVYDDFSNRAHLKAKDYDIAVTANEYIRVFDTLKKNRSMD